MIVTSLILFAVVTASAKVIDKDTEKKKKRPINFFNPKHQGSEFVGHKKSHIVSSASRAQYLQKLSSAYKRVKMVH